MFIKDEYEFDFIINDIANHPRFLDLKQELHHGISRYEHSLRVAKLTYHIAKMFHLDYERMTRAALLHDFFTENDVYGYTEKEIFKTHPKIALKNASMYFDLDERQKEMIETHMFPICDKIPRYKESYIMTLVDKAVAAHEMYRYKAALTMGIWMIFLFNMISIQK